MFPGLNQDVDYQMLATKNLKGDEHLCDIVAVGKQLGVIAEIAKRIRLHLKELRVNEFP